MFAFSLALKVEILSTALIVSVGCALTRKQKQTILIIKKEIFFIVFIIKNYVQIYTKKY
jgi:hypothetical protein